MKTSATFLALVCLLLSAGPAFCAEGSCNLEYKMVKGFSDDDMLLRMAATYMESSPGRPDGVKGTPPQAEGELRYFVGTTGSRQIIAAMDSASPPHLFIDRTGNNDLSNAKPIRRANTSTSNPYYANQYGPVLLKAAAAEDPASATSSAPAGSAAGRAFIVSIQERMLIICPAGYLAGQIRLGGKTYKVALVDGDFDGRYTACTRSDTYESAARGTSDCLAIDLNGNGSFEYASDRQPEIQVLNKLIRVDGKYYEVKAALDGSSLQMLPAEPKLGTLTTSGHKAELLVMGTGGEDYLKGPQSSWQLAAGRYTCRHIRLTATDKSGDKWALDANGNGGKLQSFEIKPGETLSVELGAPLTIKTDIQQSNSGWVFGGKEVSVGFTIVGRNGEQFSPAVEKNGTQVPAPKIKIYDEKGEVLASGDFQYG